MNTEKQKELIHSFLVTLDDEIKPLYYDIVMCLSELGYKPQQQKSNISFKHDLHTKQIAKMGTKSGKEPRPFFALRFSGCVGYSERFADIVGAAIAKYSSRVALCLEGDCHCCPGAPDTHVYTYTFPNGEQKSSCGAYTIEIPDVTADDIEEIRRLIREEHAYLVEHEASGK